MKVIINSFLLLSGIYLMHCSKSNNVKDVKLTLPKTDHELNQLLTSIDQWENEKGKRIAFNKDNTFEYTQISEPVVSGIGKYHLVNKQIKLSFSNKNTHTWLNGKKIVCEFIVNEHAWKPQQYISCIQGRSEEKFELTNPKSINSGNESNIDKVEVRILGYKPANTKRSLYIRQAPSISGKIIPFSDLGSEECLDEFHLFPSVQKPEKVNSDIYVRFPAKFDLTLIAETKEKDIVDKFENNWYFVKVFVSCIGYETSLYGWAYGEFIEKK
ncbi:hypothetical protein JWG44_18580 [Leptospira sp. 201903071]|uniref:hypothetical protein n=1 Tax=Leptospira ainazelensis TaxID=2810034 RepID=UPI001965A4C4|nr:hypothetical protein [Leptospira ainazelensis]MBM9502262.1 hypothetical protein [Leptospira ainazelensis]